MNESFSSVSLVGVTDIFSGFAFKSVDLGNFEIPVIKIKNVNDKKVSKECNQFFPTEKLTSRLEKFFLQRKDILVAMTGQGSLGRFGRMHNYEEGFLVNQRVGIIRVTVPDLCPDYLYYVLCMDTYEEQLFALGLGAGQPNVSAKDIGRLFIPKPPRPIQKKIAAVLSAYDDLIENNKRRIGLLEKTAEELYKEWFVRMRFPGHESTKFEKGIPQGWEVKRIRDVFKFLGGGTPSKNDNSLWKEGNVNWFTPTDLTKNANMFITESIDKCNETGVNSSSAKMFPAYSIMMTSRATIGVLAINTTSKSRGRFGSKSSFGNNVENSASR